MARADVTPGSTVATYNVQGTLGATAWADTFVASGEGNIVVALKVLDREDDATWSEIERIKEKLASVPDHLVLPILDAGVDEGAGVRFIATTLSDHPSLADLVDIYALSPAEAMSLVKNLGIALDAARVAEIAHGALKPSNVFVGPPPTYAVRVVDFGADALRRAKKERGALAWLAPEQLDSMDAADARTDVFTTALLAFFAMTGKSFWSAPASDEEKLAKEIAGPRGLASVRARAVGANVPPKLDAVLAKALGPREERFESPRSFAEALEAALAEPTPEIPEARSSERHIKATLRLEKFRMPTLENRAPSGMEQVAPPIGEAPPIKQRTQRMAPARLPPPAPSSSPTGPFQPPAPRTSPIPTPTPTPTPTRTTPVTLTFGISEPENDPNYLMPPSDPVQPAAPVAGETTASSATSSTTPSTPAAPIAPSVLSSTAIEPVAVRPRRTVYFPRHVLLVAVVAVTALTLGVTIAAFRKIRSEDAPPANSNATTTTSEPPGPPTSIVVPPPPSATTEDTTAADAEALGPNESELEVVCTPACDRVMLDGKTLAAYPAPARIPAGRHGVGASRTGYGGQFKFVTLKPGERQTLTFTLGELPKKK